MYHFLYTRKFVPCLLRPANLLLSGWSHGQSTCVDVTCVSPFVRSSFGK